MKRTNSKLTFQKKTFRVLDPREVARIKGGNGEGQMEIDGDMVLGGELAPNTVK
jgi:hypothetical protein